MVIKPTLISNPSASNFFIIFLLSRLAVAAEGPLLIARSPQGAFPDLFDPTDPTAPNPLPKFDLFAALPVQSQNITEIRCREEELSRGSSLWILIVLAVACAVHLPGSATFLGYKGLYRLVPEFSILEGVGTLALVIRGIGSHQASFKTSVQAALALRYFLGEGESWWVAARPRSHTIAASSDTQEGEALLPADDSISESEAFEYLDPFLSQLRSFSHARLLSFGLTTLALLKAFVVTGTIRTTLLAASYYFSFIAIEVLAWTLLEPGPPQSRAELGREAAKCAKLMRSLDPFKNEIPKWPNSEPLDLPRQQRYLNYIGDHGTLFILSLGPSSERAEGISTLTILALLSIAYISALVHVFYPVSVPLFVLWDYQVISTTKWEFIYLTWLPWAMWLPATGIILTILNALSSKALRRMVNYVKRKVTWPGRWMGWNLFLGLYVGAKVFVIFRHYLSDYTGKGTRKPAWIDWLG